MRWLQSQGSLIGLRPDGGVGDWFMPDLSEKSMVLVPKEKENPLPAGLCFGLKTAEGISWLHEWTCTQKFGEAGSPISVTTFSKEGVALSGEITSFFSSDTHVLVNKITLRNSSDTPIEGAAVLLEGRLRPGTSEEDTILTISADMPSLTHDGRGVFFALASDKAPSVMILGPKNDAVSQLATWASAGQITPTPTVTGQRIGFAVAWAMDPIQKGQDATCVVDFCFCENPEVAKTELSAAIKAKPDELLANANHPIPSGGAAQDPNALQALRVLKTLCMPSGQIVSAYPPLWGCRVWDASLASIALSSWGFHEEARAWLKYASGLSKGFGGGFYAYKAKGEQPFLPLIGVDSTGLLLYAYLQEGRADKAFVEAEWPRIKEAADFLCWWHSPDGIPAPSVNRESGGMDTGTWSLAYAYTGLASASEIARLLGKEEATLFESRALKMKESLEKDLAAEGTYVSTFASLGGLSCKGLEGWKGDSLSVFDNLHELPKGTSGKASPAALASLVWPAGLLTLDKVQLQQDKMSGLDELLAAVARKSGGQDPGLSQDPEAGEKSILFTDDDRLSRIPSLASASARSLCLSPTLPAPAALSGQGQAAGPSEDFVAKLKAGYASMDVTLDTAPDKVQLSLSLGDTLGKLPEALTLAAAPSFPGAGALPADTSGVLALSVSSDTTKWSGLADWLCTSLGLEKDQAMGIKVGLQLLLQNSEPEIDLGLLNMTSSSPFVLLAALKLKPEKAEMFSTSFPTALASILTKFNAKFEQKTSDIGNVITIPAGDDITISLIVTSQYLLITSDVDAVLSKAMAAIKDPAQSLKSKLPTLKEVGPLTLFVDITPVAQAGTSLPGFSRTFPGWSKAQNFILTVDSSKPTPTLVLRLGLAGQ